MVIAFKFINIDLTGNFKVPGINVVGLVDQFDGFIGEKVSKLLADSINQGAQSATGVGGFPGRPKNIDQCLGGNVVSFVGKEVGN